MRNGIDQLEHIPVRQRTNNQCHRNQQDSLRHLARPTLLTCLPYYANTTSFYVESSIRLKARLDTRHLVP